MPPMQPPQGTLFLGASASGAVPPTGCSFGCWEAARLCRRRPVCPRRGTLMWTRIGARHAPPPCYLFSLLLDCISHSRPAAIRFGVVVASLTSRRAPAVLAGALRARRCSSAAASALARAAWARLATLSR